MSDISTLKYLDETGDYFEISQVVFMPNVCMYKSGYHYFVYTTTRKRFVIFTFRYFKLS